MALELAFENKELRKICEDSNSAIEMYGQQVSSRLQTRLADLQAINSVKELIAGYPSVLNDESDITYKIDLVNGHRLIFCANHIKVPRNENGEVDWLKVHNIKILRIDNINE